MAENKDYVTNQVENGSVNINEDVIATIAAAAIKDVDGVTGMNGNIGEDLAGILGRKNANKGIRITLGPDYVEIECSLMVLYGYSVVEVAKNVQNGISNAVESMTGLQVKRVDVNVCGITMTKA